jgi:aminopeptidase N
VQVYGMRTLLGIYRSLRDGKRSARGALFANTLRGAISGKGLEPAYRAELLRLPSVADLMREAQTDVDPGLAFKAHRQLTRRIANLLGDDLERLYKGMRDSGPYTPDAAGAGKRALRNTVLTLLSARGSNEDLKRLSNHYFSASNMTDQAHALALLAHVESPLRTAVFSDFLERWKADDLVIDIWFAAQAQSSLPGAMESIMGLVAHPLFKITTPNKVRALVGTFATSNPTLFHRADGAGYAFVAGQILAIDRFNPQVASRLASSFRSWRTLEPTRQEKAKAAIHSIGKPTTLSRDVREIVSKMLES